MIDRTARASRVLYAWLIFLTLGAIIALGSLNVWVLDETARGQFAVESAKALLQVVTVAILGGLVKLLIDDQQRLQREANDERQRELREATDTRVRAEANEARLESFRTDKVRRLVGVTNVLRRAPVLIEAHRSARTYNEQMREIVNAGLELRLIRHETDAIGPERNPAFREWPRIRDAIREMEEYISWVAGDFRNHSKALSEKQQRAEMNRDLQSSVWDIILALDSVRDLLDGDGTGDEGTRYYTRYLGAHETALRLMVISSFGQHVDENKGV